MLLEILESEWVLGLRLRDRIAMSGGSAMVSEQRNWHNDDREHCLTQSVCLPGLWLLVLLRKDHPDAPVLHLISTFRATT